MGLFSLAFGGERSIYFSFGGNLNDYAVLLNFDEGIWFVFLLRMSRPATFPLGFSLITSSSPNWGELILMGKVLGNLM